MSRSSSRRPPARGVMVSLCAAVAVLAGVATGCAAGLKSPSMAARPSLAGSTNAVSTPGTAESSTTPPTLRMEEQLVVEGSVAIAVTDVPKSVVAIRDWVRGAKGRVITEDVHGAAESWSGRLRIRVPPREVPAFVDWLASQGEVTRKRLNATDVSRKLFDQDIALGNMQRTLDRLRKLLDKPGLSMKEILSIENQMRRLRRSIESVKGEKRWLKDRVALATIEVAVTRKKGEVFGPKAKLYPGPRLSGLSMTGRNYTSDLRLGAGLVIGVPPIPGKTGAPRVTFEVDVFERGDTNSRAAVITSGAAVYSDFLGRGERRLLNPYLDFRMGYGYLDGSKFVVASGGGVELFKHKHVVVDANVRATAFIDDSVEVGVVGGATVLVSF